MDTALTAGHTDEHYGTHDSVYSRITNTPDNNTRSYLEDDDYLDKYLHFEYRPLSYYFSINKINKLIG